jgi:hypothetical protein
LLRRVICLLHEGFLSLAENHHIRNDLVHGGPITNSSSGLKKLGHVSFSTLSPLNSNGVGGTEKLVLETHTTGVGTMS